jgi:hypothetical protein
MRLLSGLLFSCLGMIAQAQPSSQPFGGVAPEDESIGPYGSGFTFKRTTSSQFALTIGGRFKLDAFFDTQQINSDLPFFAEPEQVVFVDAVNGDSLVANPNDLTNSFNLSIRELNLQLSMTTPPVNNWSNFGYFEANFFGFFPEGANALNASPVLRFAYFTATNQNTKTAITAGQIEGPFSPLDPMTLSAETFVLFGDIFSSSPQVRVTQPWKNLKFEAAIARPVDLFNDVKRGFDIVGRGQDSGLPEFQGRISYNFPKLSGRYWYYQSPGSVGVSARAMRERFNAGTVDQADVPSITASLDWFLPIGKSLTFQGEAYWGKNTDNALGLSGVAGALNANGVFVPQGSVEELGGWALLGYHYKDRLYTSLTAGAVFPDAAAFAVNGVQEDSALDITRNTGVATTAWWRFLPTTMFGLEYTRIDTERFLRLNNDTAGAFVDGTLHRIQAGFLFSF